MNFMIPNSPFLYKQPNLTELRTTENYFLLNKITLPTFKMCDCHTDKVFGYSLFQSLWDHTNVRRQQ